MYYLWFFFGEKKISVDIRREHGRANIGIKGARTNCARKYTSFTPVDATIRPSRWATECDGSIESTYSTTTVAGIMCTPRGRRLYVPTIQNNHGAVVVVVGCSGFFQLGVRDRAGSETEQERHAGQTTRRWETSRPAGQCDPRHAIAITVRRLPPRGDERQAHVE